MFDDLQCQNPVYFVRKCLLDMSQKAFGEALGCSQSAANYWEKNRQIPQHLWLEVGALARSRGVAWRDEYLLQSGIPSKCPRHDSEGADKSPPTKEGGDMETLARLCVLVALYPAETRVLLEELEAAEAEAQSEADELAAAEANAVRGDGALEDDALSGEAA